MKFSVKESPDYDIPFFVINLEKSKERKEYMIDQLKKRNLNGVIFKAVDGSQLDIAELQAKGEYDDDYAHKKFSRSLSLNEIGCALSHVNLYKEMIRKNINMCVICEDDISLVVNYKKEMENVINELPNDWELVYFWYRTKEIKKVSNSIVSFPSKNHIPGGAVCYMLKKSGAEKLIKEAFPIHYPSDSLLGRGYRWGIKIYGTKPKLAELNLMFPSTIRETKMVTNLIKKFLLYIAIKR